MHENDIVFLLQIEYTLLADVRMVKHGIPDLKSDALVNPTKATNDITKEKLAAKATNGSTDEKLAADQTTMGSCQPERGHITAKGNVHFTIIGVYGL